MSWNRWRSKNKFNAKKTWIDSIRFDSQMEANHYQDLKLLEAAGIIAELEIQKELVLTVNGHQICIYIADFFFKNLENDRWTVGETKGKETDAFRLKWKLSQALYPNYDYRLFKRKHVVI